MGSIQKSRRIRESSHFRGSLVSLQEGAKAGKEGLDGIKDFECLSGGN